MVIGRVSGQSSFSPQAIEELRARSTRSSVSTCRWGSSTSTSSSAW
jgi:hypothetical protein